MEENWKQFQGTEIGSLLSSIYGKNANKINYPIPQTKAFTPTRQFTSSGSAIRNPKVRKQIPDIEYYQKKTTRLPTRAAVDLIPKRKHENHIKEEISQIQYQQQHYRPAFNQPVSTDAEKLRLNQIFTHKGGKGLPQDFVLPVTKAPFEIEHEKRMQPRQSPSVHSVALSPEDELAKQITDEINDRVAHLTEMKTNGIISQYEEITIENEIKLRVRELKMLQNTSRNSR